MSEVKAGESVDFKFDGDKTLTVEALPYGQLKKILRIVFSISTDIKAGAVSTIPDLVERYMSQIVPLLFKADKYPWLTPDWFDDNLTVPVIRKIIDTAVVVNGLEDFFGKKVKTGMAPPGISPIPPENSGSITSSGSVTDGSQKTLTN